jgi:hypothetical protein
MFNLKTNNPNKTQLTLEIFPKMDYAGFLALMEAASPDLEKQGLFAVVFVNREI